jgi:TrmH family RNA methyltransferase
VPNPVRDPRASPAPPADRAVISSRRHPIVERCRALAARRRPGDALILDGPHLISVALAERWPLEIVFAPAEALRGFGEGEIASLVTRCERAGALVVLVTPAVLEAVSPVRTPSGVVAIAAPRAASVESMLVPPPALLVIAVDVQDPGNAGAIVRAADAFGATGVIGCGESADPFGWKALRGSMGSALRVPLVRERDVDKALNRLREHGVRLAVAVAQGGVDPADADWRSPIALVVGNEGAGLPRELTEGADLAVAVPVRAGVESLNVAVAAGVLLYEAQRQRRTGARG